MTTSAHKDAEETGGVILSSDQQHELLTQILTVAGATMPPSVEGTKPDHLKANLSTADIEALLHRLLAEEDKFEGDLRVLVDTIIDLAVELLKDKQKAETPSVKPDDAPTVTNEDAEVKAAVASPAPEETPVSQDEALSSRLEVKASADRGLPTAAEPEAPAEKPVFALVRAEKPQAAEASEFPTKKPIDTDKLPPDEPSIEAVNLAGKSPSQMPTTPNGHPTTPSGEDEETSLFKAGPDEASPPSILIPVEQASVTDPTALAHATPAIGPSSAPTPSVIIKQPNPNPLPRPKPPLKKRPAPDSEMGIRTIAREGGRPSPTADEPEIIVTEDVLTPSLAPRSQPRSKHLPANLVGEIEAEMEEAKKQRTGDSAPPERASDSIFNVKTGEKIDLSPPPTDVPPPEQAAEPNAEPAAKPDPTTKMPATPDFAPLPPPAQPPVGRTGAARRAFERAVAVAKRNAWPIAVAAVVLLAIIGTAVAKQFLGTPAAPVADAPKGQPVTPELLAKVAEASGGKKSGTPDCWKTAWADAPGSGPYVDCSEAHHPIAKFTPDGNPECYSVTECRVVIPQ